jgi:FkbM family methyltransferase
MRTSHYLGDHVALTTTKFDDKIYVDTRDTSLAPHLLVSGDWEPWVTNAFRVMLARFSGGAVIDVGANFGWYTLLANRCGASAVIAVEPHPDIFPLLQKSIVVNGYARRTVAKQVACGALGPGVIEQRLLEYSPTELGGGKVRAETGGTPAASSVPPWFFRPSATWAATVACVSLDDLVVPSLLPADRIIVKIDVEGGEVDVLRGAPTLLAEKPVLFVEHHRENVGALFELIGERYSIKQVLHTGHPGAPLSPDAALEIEDAETLLCEPRS